MNNIAYRNMKDLINRMNLHFERLTKSEFDKVWNEVSNESVSEGYYVYEILNVQNEL